MRIKLVVLLLLAPAYAYAQDPCLTPTTASDTITTGKAPTVRFKLAKQKPLSVDDPTLVPNTVDGFTIAVAGVTLPDFSVGTLPIPVACSDGLNNGYVIKLPSGYQKGTYTLSLKAFAFARDVNGVPTTTKLESVVVTRPFVVADPPVTAPTNPTGVKVSNQ